MGTYGLCTITGSQNYSIERVITGVQFTTPADMDKNTNYRIRIKNTLASTLKFKPAIYADSGDYPAALVWAGAQTLAAASTTTTYNFPQDLSLSPSTKYWFVAWGEYYNSARLYVMADNTVQELLVALDRTYYPDDPSFPDPFPAGGFTWTSACPEICLTYSAVAAAKQACGDGLVFFET